MHVGSKVCLLNEFSASNGDMFPYRFKHYKLGKLIDNDPALEFVRIDQQLNKGIEAAFEELEKNPVKKNCNPALSNKK